VRTGAHGLRVRASKQEFASGSQTLHTHAASRTKGASLQTTPSKSLLVPAGLALGRPPVKARAVHSEDSKQVCSLWSHRSGFGALTVDLEPGPASPVDACSTAFPMQHAHTQTHAHTFCNPVFPVPRLPAGEVRLWAQPSLALCCRIDAGCHFHTGICGVCHGTVPGPSA